MVKRILVCALGAAALFVGIAAISNSHAQVRKRILFDDAFTQEGTPLKLMQVTHRSAYGIDSAEVLNALSDRSVISVTFGAVLRDPSPSGAEPIFLHGRPIPTSIKPGETRTISVLQFPVQEMKDKIAKFKGNVAVVDFGIERMEFGDGSPWEFDMERYKSFAPQSNIAMNSGGKTKLAVACNKRPMSTFASFMNKLVPTVYADPGWECVPTNASTICSINIDGEGCANRNCTHQNIINGTCTRQICAVTP
jgi:hypothetical protein